MTKKEHDQIMESLEEFTRQYQGLLISMKLLKGQSVKTDEIAKRLTEIWANYLRVFGGSPVNPQPNYQKLIGLLVYFIGLLVYLIALVVYFIALVVYFIALLVYAVSNNHCSSLIGILNIPKYQFFLYVSYVRIYVSIFCWYFGIFDTPRESMIII